MPSHSVEKQSNAIWNDIINETKNGPVKVTPPPGYIPPPSSKLKPRKYNQPLNPGNIY